MAATNLARLLCRRRAKRLRCISWMTWIQKWRRCARRWKLPPGTRSGPSEILRCIVRFCAARNFWPPRMPDVRRMLRRATPHSRLRPVRRAVRAAGDERNRERDREHSFMTEITARLSSPRRALLDLAPLELDCMNTLWPMGQGTVREIRDRLAARRPRAYTTIMTIMDRLARKGVVERRKVGRAYMYSPNLSAEDARTQALGQVIENFCGGSKDALLAQLTAAAPRVRAAAAALGADGDDAAVVVAAKRRNDSSS